MQEQIQLTIKERLKETSPNVNQSSNKVIDSNGNSTMKTLSQQVNIQDIKKTTNLNDEKGVSKQNLLINNQTKG